MRITACISDVTALLHKIPVRTANRKGCLIHSAVVPSKLTNYREVYDDKKVLRFYEDFPFFVVYFKEATT